jgi:O-succinylbenzoic acid--CoA ligase
VARLVPLDAVPGPAFVASLQRIWDDGDAVLPMDPRLPPAARAALVAAMSVDAGVAAGDALVVATSGTTGEPKGVVLTHDAVAAAARITNEALAVDPSRDVWLSQLPLAHVGGLGVITRAVLSGTRLTFDASEPATLTSAVPTQLERDDHTRFRAVLVGGSADWRTDRAAHVVRTYGLTESFGGVVYDRRPLAGVEVRIGDDGAVLLRSPTLLRCYRDGTDPKDADGWLVTGDVGAVDADGLLHIDGRRGDVIVTGGEKVWPDPVEQLLRAVPGVADVAVVGRPDPEWGQSVTAVVVPTDASSPPTLDQLRAAVRAELPPWCAPRAVELRTDLPRTALGKVRRSRLQ